MRVLIVEDDKQLCEVFHDYLVEIGHDPFVAHTAEELTHRLGGKWPHGGK